MSVSISASLGSRLSEVDSKATHRPPLEMDAWMLEFDPLTPASDVEASVSVPVVRSFTKMSDIESASAGSRFEARDGSELYPFPFVPPVDVDTSLMSPVARFFR